MAKRLKRSKSWLSENDTALIIAIKALCQLLIDKGVATPDEVDTVMLEERDRFAVREHIHTAPILHILVEQQVVAFGEQYGSQGAAIFQIVVEQRRQDSQSLLDSRR